MLCQKQSDAASTTLTPDSIELRIRLSGPTIIKLVSIAVAVAFSSIMYGGL